MRKLFILLTAAFLSFLPTIAQAAGDDLGVAVQVLVGGQDSSKNVNQNNKLWFVIEPGSSGSRTIMVASTSNVDQIVELSLGAQKETNGVLAYDQEGTTKASEWVAFSKNNFTLKANKSTEITMTLRVPKNAAIEILKPALLVQAKVAKTAKAQYKIPTAMRFIQSMFLGVGTADEFSTKFTIDDVYGLTTERGREIFIKFSNNGGTPIALEGDLQLSSQTFSGQNFGPFKFSSATILPGTSGITSIAADAAVNEDKFKILVRARMGAVEVSREFVKDLSFPVPSAWPSVLLNGALILAALIAGTLSLRALRRPAKPEVEVAAKSMPVTPRKKFTTNNIVILFLIFVYKAVRKRVLNR
jgi:hypothetical protein